MYVFAETVKKRNGKTRFGAGNILTIALIQTTSLKWKLQCGVHIFEFLPSLYVLVEIYTLEQVTNSFARKVFFLMYSYY